MIQPHELKGLRAAVRLFGGAPVSTSVEDCVYNMQLAERCMEADLAMAAEARTDSTVCPDWQLLISAVSTIVRHQRSAYGRMTRLLNGIERARKHRADLAWRRANPEKYKAQKARERANLRARRLAASPGDKS